MRTTSISLGMNLGGRISRGIRPKYMIYLYSGELLGNTSGRCIYFLIFYFFSWLPRHDGFLEALREAIFRAFHSWKYASD